MSAQRKAYPGRCRFEPAIWAGINSMYAECAFCTCTSGMSLWMYIYMYMHAHLHAYMYMYLSRQTEGSPYHQSSISSAAVWDAVSWASPRQLSPPLPPCSSSPARSAALTRTPAFLHTSPHCLRSASGVCRSSAPSDRNLHPVYIHVHNYTVKGKMLSCLEWDSNLSLLGWHSAH